MQIVQHELRVLINLYFSQNDHERKKIIRVKLKLNHFNAITAAQQKGKKE